MKIGILTLPLQSNYGGILQAYTLQTVLERLGHEVVVINKSRYRHLNPVKKPFIYVYRMIMKYLFSSPITIRREKGFNKVLDNLSRKQLYTKDFICKNIHHLDIDSFSELKEKDFDAIVVGSDQIWRSVYAYSMMQSLRDAYLYFAKDWSTIKRVAYAASFGTEDWEYTKKDTSVCGKLIKKFDAVSVRELSGISLCKEFFKYNNAVSMIDPTLLLDRCDYVHLADNKRQAHVNGGLFSYILDKREETLHFEEVVIRQTKLNYFSQQLSEDFACDEAFAPVMPVEAWIRAFEDCEMIITDSFHACAFAIIFNKPFWVIGNKERGLSRLHSLLNLFHLENRMISDNENLERYNWNESINWEPINEQRNFLKSQSVQFLKKNL